MSFVRAPSNRKAAASSSPEFRRVDCFSIVAEADPSVLPRIMDIVAMFDLIPLRCHCARLDHEPGKPLIIDLQLADLSADVVHRIEKKLERMVFVTQILCSEKRQAAA